MFRIVANFSLRYFIIGNQSPGNLERESARIAYGIRIGQFTSASQVADAFRAINPDRSFQTDFALATLTRARARIARHILANINTHMSKKEKKSGVELVANPDAKKVNLEHILPQSIGSTWETSFSRDVDPKDYVYRIGNLTLLNSRINSEAANKSFIDKKKIAFNDSSLVLNDFVKRQSKWGDQEIDSRQDTFAGLALEIWKLK